MSCYFAVPASFNEHPQLTISKNTDHRDRQKIPSVSLIEFTSGSRKEGRGGNISTSDSVYQTSGITGGI